MKKKLLFLVLSLSVMTLAWGCGKKNIGDGLQPDNTNTEVTPGADSDNSEGDSTVPEAPVKEAYEVDDYITLGDYKGLTVTYTKREVTDTDVEDAIQDELNANAEEKEVTDRAVQTGDTVNLDYEGLKDGVAFEGGTAQGFDLEIGSNQFIDGFEEGLIGAKVGDELALDLTFPSPYERNPDLAGQPVVFNVKVNAIKVSIVPELTEDYVKDNTDYDSIAAYKEAIRADLVEENEDAMRNEKATNLLTAIIENSTISSYPQSLLDYYSYELESSYTQYAAMFGYSLEDFVSLNGITMEDFEADMKSLAESRAAQELVLVAIIKAEKLDITEDEYKKGIADFVDQYGYESEEQFLQYATEEQIRESLTWEKAVDFIIGQSVEA
ncbi:trigger factor [Anaerotaenia torta]|uniref:trigger factor n=1 Tax=Anaerotaenia torta TaxID=433293 RepID=UPI003D25A693